MRVGISGQEANVSFYDDLWQLMQWENCASIEWISKAEWQPAVNASEMEAVYKGIVDTVSDLWVYTPYRAQILKFSYIVRTSPQVKVWIYFK